MKKIVYALIAVLLLGTFVACNGDVNSSLWEDAYIVLKISNSDYYKFDNGSTMYVLKLSGRPETWNDYRERV